MKLAISQITRFPKIADIFFRKNLNWPRKIGKQFVQQNLDPLFFIFFCVCKTKSPVGLLYTVLLPDRWSPEPDRYSELGKLEKPGKLERTWKTRKT
jgi:hypothetical protein